MAHPTAIRIVDLTDARTGCLATRYMAHTARMAGRPIGARIHTILIPMAMTATAKLF
jgi:hypothetical protein